MNMNRKQGFAPMLAVLIILIILGGGVYLYTKSKVQTPVANLETGPLSQSNAQSPSTSLSTNNSTDVKLCRNKRYGYEVSYPSSWKVIYAGSHAEGGDRIATCEEGLSSIILSPDINWISSPHIRIEAQNQNDLSQNSIFCSHGCNTAEDYLSNWTGPTGWAVNMGRLPDSKIDGEKLIWTAFHREGIYQGKMVKLDDFDLTNLGLYTSHKSILYMFGVSKLNGTKEFNDFRSTFKFISTTTSSD